jgi:glycosyltransferase involved in cell wall biosynthesis
VKVAGPFASVVVPTYRRAAWLPGLLEAFAGQDYPAGRFEVVVVDDDSQDGTAELIADWTKWAAFDLRCQLNHRGGAAAARNSGAALARGEILAFTDSDCLPSPSWISCGVAAYEGGARLVTGPIRPVGEHGFFWHQMDEVVRDNGLYPTANLFVATDAFRAAGGFNASLGFYPWGAARFGDDTEFGWKVRRLGYRTEFAPAARVDHLPSRLTLKAWLLSPIQTEAGPRLLRDIPELRHTFLWRGYFLSSGHFLFYVACAGLLSAALARSPLPLLTTLPWLWRIAPGVVPTMLRGRILKAAGLFAAITYLYVAHAAVLMVASLRFRRLLL